MGKVHLAASLTFTLLSTSETLPFHQGSHARSGVFHGTGAAGSFTHANRSLPSATSKTDNILSFVDGEIFAEMPILSHTVEPAVNVTCGDKQVSFPGSAILLKHGRRKALWCPNAKVGTSTIFTLIDTLMKGANPKSAGHARKHGHGDSVSHIVKRGDEQELCNVDFSFVFLRNPYDRLRSAYLDKINRVVHVPGHAHATFDEFVHAIHHIAPKQMNVHWKPISTRCLTKGETRYTRFAYTKKYKIETHFEDSVVEAFSKIGYPTHKVRNVLATIGSRNQNPTENHTITGRRQFYKNVHGNVVNIIRKIYRDDFKVGGYTFETLA